MPCLPLYLLNVTRLENLRFSSTIYKKVNNWGDKFTEVRIKNLTVDQIRISVDRLTRFKYTEDKYLRVFKDIILSNLIEPRFKRKDLDVMEYSYLRDYAEYIFNKSVEELVSGITNTLKINEKLSIYENKIFNLSYDINELLNNKINYDGIITLLKDKNLPKNLIWLKSLVYDKQIREEQAARFPIEKVVITEGITEEILLPVFAEHLGFDFNKKGVHVISAGGKNQVVKLVYALVKQLKLPMFILLDNDAKSNYEQILPKLRTFDKIHLLTHGEFEDILPKELILKTLNDYFKNLNYIEEKEFDDERMVKNLEEIFKRKGFHEFKKAEFALLVKSHISSEEDFSDEIKNIINEVKTLTSSVNL